MHKKLITIFIILLILNKVFTQYNISYQDVIFNKNVTKKISTKALLIDTEFPEELLKEGLDNYMENNNRSKYKFTFNYSVYKNIILEKMPNDSSPYFNYNFNFSFKSIVNGSKYNTFMYLIITTTKDETIDLIKYKCILESGKKWIDKFMVYFKEKFIPEREKKMIQESIIKIKALREKTISDSLETINNIKNKIRENEDELNKLNTSLQNQRSIFENSIINQKKTIDSLKNKLEELKIK